MDEYEAPDGGEETAPVQDEARKNVAEVRMKELELRKPEL